MGMNKDNGKYNENDRDGSGYTVVCRDYGN